MREERELYTKCKSCGSGMYYVSGEKGGRPPAFCEECLEDGSAREYQQQNIRESRERLKARKKGIAAVDHIIKQSGVQKNKTIDDILLELKAEGKGPEAFAEYKRKKALEKVTPIIR